MVTVVNNERFPKLGMDIDNSSGAVPPERKHALTGRT